MQQFTNVRCVVEHEILNQNLMMGAKWLAPSLVGNPQVNPWPTPTKPASREEFRGKNI